MPAGNPSPKLAITIAPDVHAQVLAEALAFYFADQDRQALAAVYSEAARDPEFQADNEAVQQDFAALDREAARAIR